MAFKPTPQLNRILFFCFAFVSVANGQSGFSTHDEGYQVIADSAGLHTKPYGFDPEKLFPKDAWTGDWIWLDPSRFKDYQQTRIEWKQNPEYVRQYKALFRKSFVLTALPQQAFLSITADVSFRLYINGTFVAQGPANIGNDFFDGVPPKHWFFTTHNVKRYLSPGKNTIAVEVYSHFREISETSSGQGMLIADLETGVGKPVLATDASWKCSMDTSFTVTGGNYRYNATSEVPNWIDQTFDESGWANASVKSIPKKGYLVASKIPVPFRHPVKPRQCWPAGNPAGPAAFSPTAFDKTFYSEGFTLDYGRNMTAYYGFQIIAHRNDTLKIHPFEKKYASENRALVFVCNEGVNVFYAPYLSVFRYLKVEIQSQKGLIINDIRADFSSYPVSYTGSFSCSDPNLTRLWDITRWTTQLCMNDMFYDSPKHQEPIACTGDYLIESLINYYAFGDRWLARQTLVKTAWMLEKNNYDMFHTSYSLLWVQMLRQYYHHTADTALVKQLLPHVNKLNELFATYLDKDYLVSQAPDYMFMDWIKIDRFNAHHPPAVIGMGYMSAFYYKSLLDASFLNSLAGNTPIGDKNLALAGKIKRAMNGLLWDNDQKRYKDGLPFRSQAPSHYFFPKDTALTTYSPHVNALAVLYDIAPKNQQPALLDYAVSQKAIDLQPYFMFFVLSAVQHTGQFHTLGLELLKKWEDGINTETHTLKENWQDQTETGYGGDYSHAWGGSPLYFLSRDLLGVKPALAGYKEIEIDPFAGQTIHWAQGQVPLTGGKYLDIRWTKESEHTYHYQLEIPDGYRAFLRIAQPIHEKGFAINRKKYPKGTSRVPLSSGSYRIEFKR